MIGIVIVSHSEKLAAGVCELAGQMAQGKVRLAAAGGTDDPENPIGTDAFKVVRAIESVFDADGVLVLMDLGSALLSADTALELLADGMRAKTRLCGAPLVEGAISAVGKALAGGTLEEVALEAERALSAKLGQASTTEPTVNETVITIPNRLGIHARPAVHIVHSTGRFQAQISIRNVTRSRGPVDARSINGLLSLAARRGDEVAVSAQGADAMAALSAISELIRSGFGEDEETEARPKTPSTSEPDALKGVAASAGIAVGPVRHFRVLRPQVAFTATGNAQAEKERLLDAIHGAREETEHIAEWTRQQISEKDAAIFEAQSMLLDDLREDAVARVVGSQASAEYAWQGAVSEMAGRLRNLDDDYLRERAADVEDIGERVQRRLTGDLAPLRFDEPGILVARDLTPSQVQALDPAKVQGLCLEAGGASAHSLILARAMGIPAVVGVGPAMANIPEGTPAAVDGGRGLVWISPGLERLHKLEIAHAEWLAARDSARASRLQPACTRDGRRIKVFANISGVAEATQGLECGAEGVGVLRTEFLFLNRTNAPTEDEQAEVYSAIAETLRPQPLVVRTLDVGGDKNLPYIAMAEEANPFLGWRGIRVSLTERDLFKAQVRAILRASRAGEVEILLPMISTLQELRAARAVIEEAESELGVARAKLGVMIEVPSAAAIADLLAREVDFFSIGTNDLTQYVMAVDRTNPRVGAMADSLDPAVLRTVRQVVTAGKKANIGVTLCGELAGDPVATRLLIGLGIDEFSMSPTLIPAVKQAIVTSTAKEAEQLAQEIMQLDSMDAVRNRLR